MPVVTFLPTGKRGRVKAGTTVLDAHVKAGLPPFFDCGGLGLCGKCRVRYRTPAPSPSPTELRSLTATELREGYRLACLCRVDDDALVEIAFTQVGRTFKELAASGGRQPVLEPSVRRAPVPAQASGDAQESILFDGSVLRLRPACGRPLLGVALDIGTTTMAGYLVDLETGEEKASLGLRNPQIAYGSDVISRIRAATQEGQGPKPLQSLCLGGLRRLLSSLLAQAHCAPEDIFHAVVVGNPTMLSLFLGVDPGPISFPPFEPLFKDARVLEAEALPLGLPPRAVIETLPLVSGYVGADTVGMVLYLGLEERPETCLAVDVGTNGELVLSARGRLYACSTAAGPAFEGSQIACGMRAQMGAIDRFSWDTASDALSYHTLGGAKARGISGSGLVSAVALLLDKGAVLPSGRFARPEAMPLTLRNRLRQGTPHQEIALVAKEEAARGQEIVLTQRDVRELQLAKAAMAAGMRRLLDHAGITASDLDRVYLAGSFGTSLDPQTARRIGLLPPVPLERVVAVGNAAGAGAKMVLCSSPMREMAARLAESIAYQELSSDPEFSEWFQGALVFPESADESFPPFE